MKYAFIRFKKWLKRKFKKKQQCVEIELSATPFTNAPQYMCNTKNKEAK